MYEVSCEIYTDHKNLKYIFTRSELNKDYNITINYHPGKANVVTVALSQESGGSLATLITGQPELLRDLEELQLEMKFAESFKLKTQLNQMSVKFDLYVKSAKHNKKILI